MKDIIISLDYELRWGMDIVYGDSMNQASSHIENTPIVIKKMIDLFNKYFQSGSCKKKLDIEIFKNYKIRIPPHEIQREILKKIEPKERLINQLEKNINRAEKEAKEIMDVLFK